MTAGLRSSTAIDLRPWPHDPSVCHLILRDHATVPTAADVDRWIDRVLARSDRASTTVRTSALFPRSAQPFLDRGFVPVDRLVLLERRLDRPPEPAERRSARMATVSADHDLVERSEPSPGATLRGTKHPIRLRRPSRRRLRNAVEIDRRAFGPTWANDLASLRHTIAATPEGRVRVAELDANPVGFAVTGKASHVGYLQRLAVVPDAQRRGVARLLVDDAIAWLTRRGATSVLVNTGLDNEPALELYRGAGFRRRPEELVVLECVLRSR